MIYIRMSRNTSKESRRKEVIKGKKIIISLKRELLYPRFGTLKQQKIKIKANLKKQSKHKLDTMRLCIYIWRVKLLNDVETNVKKKYHRYIKKD